MLRTAQDGHRRAWMLAVLVVGLLAGLIAMHHLAVGGAEPHRGTMSAGAESAHTSAPDVEVGMPSDDLPSAPLPSDHGDTGLLHLCLAILTGVAVLIAVMPGWLRGEMLIAGALVRSGRPAPAPRAPPPSAPARLALLCVLRT